MKESGREGKAEKERQGEISSICWLTTLITTTARAVEEPGSPSGSPCGCQGLRVLRPSSAALVGPSPGSWSGSRAAKTPLTLGVWDASSNLIHSATLSAPVYKYTHMYITFYVIIYVFVDF